MTVREQYTNKSLAVDVVLFLCCSFAESRRSFVDQILREELAHHFESGDDQKSASSSSSSDSYHTAPEEPYESDHSDFQSSGVWFS